MCKELQLFFSLYFWVPHFAVRKPISWTTFRRNFLQVKITLQAI